MSIDYACRPRLRSRLTLGGLAWPRNPWSFGGRVSHPSFATHVYILTRVGSTAGFLRRFTTYTTLSYPFATSALRESANGDSILKSINSELSIDLQVLSGEEEAKLTFLAARRWFGWSSGRLLVIDIGGGSLEIAVGTDEAPEVAVSLPLGAARLTQNYLTGDPYSNKSVNNLRDHIEEQLDSILPALVHHQDTDRAIATSKTLRTLARLCGDWFDGNGKNIKIDAIRKICNRLGDMTLEERTRLPGVSANRARQIVAGAYVTESVMRNLDLRELEICPWALREGVVLKWMDWTEK